MVTECPMRSCGLDNFGVVSLRERSQFTYDVSSRGGGGFEMLTVADKEGGRVSKPC